MHLNGMNFIKILPLCPGLYASCGHADHVLLFIISLFFRREIASMCIQRDYMHDALDALNGGSL